ncbi:hypothetical protein LIR34_11640 [Blautia sp. MSK17_66]|uniref:hypothetical protein n=1 Tax=Blautia TaxID=572511 RepID=UPI00156E9676|nr:MULTISPECIES: hypothetical protein [Blautia]MCB5550463.1 hypothetical protein [Blautia sp. MSK17_66]NSK02050.1 hypothetical protein [Blautia obeum]
MQDRTYLKQKYRKISVALISNLLILGAMAAFMRPSFETNDDIVFAELGSGLRGVKDAHLVFQNYGLGMIYRLLYGVTGRLPWYTIVQYMILFAAFTVVTYVLISRLGEISGLCLFVILACGFGYEGYIHLQFTKTAGIAAAAAVFLLLYLLEQEKYSWWGIAGGILLAVIAYMYREDQFWASCGLMAGAGLLFLFDLRKYRNKKLRRLEICVLTFGVLLLSVFGVDRWDSSKYRSAEWKEYQEFNQLRSELLDYGFPDYDSNQEIYEELGISREAYELYKSWNFNDTEKFDTEVMKKLVDLKQKRPLTIRTVTAFLRRFPSDLLRMPMFYFFAVFAVLWLLCGKKDVFSIISVLAECLLLVAVYFYLYYQGRYMVNRVDVGLWFSACLVMLWIFSSGEVRYMNTKVSVLLCMICVVLGQFMMYKDWRLATSSIPEARVSQRAVLETIGTDKEHTYLAKSGMLSEIVCYGPFDRMPENLLDNVYWFGGWECRTPGYTRAMEVRGIINPYRDVVNNENVYLVDDNIDLTLKYIRQYYAENAEAVFVKTIGNVDVYQITDDSVKKE